MLDEATKQAIARRRDKTIAVILRFKEDECDTYLPQSVSQQLRKLVLDQVNELHEMTMELVNFSTSTPQFNDIYAEKLNEIHELLEGMNERV